MSLEAERQRLVEAFRRAPEDRTLTLGAWRRLGLSDSDLLDAAFPLDPDTGSYSELVTAAGEELLAEEATGDYQGDYHYLLRSGNQFAYVQVGYGSCSGCDMLQGIQGDRGEMSKYRHELWSSIQWQTKDELITWFESKDTTTEWNAGEVGPVYAKFSALLKGLP